MPEDLNRRDDDREETKGPYDGNDDALNFATQARQWEIACDIWEAWQNATGETVLQSGLHKLGDVPWGSLVEILDAVPEETWAKLGMRPRDKAFLRGLAANTLTDQEGIEIGDVYGEFLAGVLDAMAKIAVTLKPLEDGREKVDSLREEMRHFLSQ